MREAKLHENPLVPNKKLRQMYMAMLGARALDERFGGLKAGGKSRSKLRSIRGEEACRIGTAIDLASADLISDPQAGIVMDLPAGADTDSLLRGMKKKSAGRKHVAEEGGKQLPWVKDASERLRLAMGVALSFKILKHANAVLAYIHQGEVGNGQWRRILRTASKLDLPIFFIVLPAITAKKKKNQPSHLSARARTSEVPGILVDANDVVAVYRVTQEALGRIRGGGGPVLLECEAYKLEGGPILAPLDPVLQMKNLLLSRKLATKAWLDASEDRIKRRVAAM